jgi:hypothetical protein
VWVAGCAAPLMVFYCEPFVSAFAAIHKTENDSISVN